MGWPTHIIAILILLAAFHHNSVLSQNRIWVCDQDQTANLPFCDPSLSSEERIQDLILRIPLDEKIGIIADNAYAADSAGLPAYDWWNEALHGVAHSVGTHFRPPTEVATSFPQILNLASSFNVDLFYRVGNVTGNEARAFFNAGNSGLTFWSPNINVYRDPRWGRGHETPGEDPFLNGRYAVAFVTGMQNRDDTEFLKTSACCKHFVAHSIEEGRNHFNAVVNDRDMADTYLPAFRSCVEEGRVSCVMSAYNAVNGIPATAHKELLTGTLREKWGFDGYIVSDCGAVNDVFNSYHYTNTTSETCEAVLDAGMDTPCDQFLRDHLGEATGDGTVTEELIDTALYRGFNVLMRAGYFEKETVRPYSDLTPDTINTPAHQELALEAARQSIVLLKNDEVGPGRRLLPLDRFGPDLAIIGPHFDAKQVFLGNYFGDPPFIISPVEGIEKYFPTVATARGCDLTSLDESGLEGAVELARKSNRVVLFVGISGDIEGETYDRNNISLPGLQPELIRRVSEASQFPVTLFLISGGPIDLQEFKDNPKVGAIVYGGYLGQAAGEAMADVLFGAYNPAGRLTHTFYSSQFLEQASMPNMNMRPNPETGFPGRTYRFYQGLPIFEFGFGLSYTTFDYNLVQVQPAPGEECLAVVELMVRNSGQQNGDHSALFFLSPPEAGQLGRPIKTLVNFKRFSNLEPNQEENTRVCLSRDMFSLADVSGGFVLVPGQWELSVDNRTLSIDIVDAFLVNVTRNVCSNSI